VVCTGGAMLSLGRPWWRGSSATCAVPLLSLVVSGGEGVRRRVRFLSFLWPSVVPRKESRALAIASSACTAACRGCLRRGGAPLPLLEPATMVVAVSAVECEPAASGSPQGASPGRLIDGQFLHPAGLQGCRAAAPTCISSVRRRLPAFRLQVMCPRRCHGGPVRSPSPIWWQRWKEDQITFVFLV
jgi:hypothetical protein